jgi:DNA-binding response OmpR family regulator
MRLLIVEDNPRLAALIGKALSDQAFAVDSVASVEAASAALHTATYDLILLDLALPDADGEDILRSLRARGRATPVLVMTARGDVLDRVRILNEGADDYLVKPFSLDELLARVRAVMRRPPEITGNLHRAGNVLLDSTALSATVGGEAADLPRREFAVLLTLMRNQGRLLPKQKLVDAVYSFDNEVTPNAIEAVVSRLRRRLEALGADVTISAMRGLGYILAPDPPDAPTT